MNKLMFLINRALRAVLIVLLFFNCTVAGTDEVKLRLNIIVNNHPFATDDLAPELRLTRNEFKEKYLSRMALLAHEAVNKYIARFAGIRGINGLIHRDDKVAISGSEYQDIIIAVIPDLLKNTGQFAHVGLGSKNYKFLKLGFKKAIPVIYVDPDYYYNESVIAHDKNEIIKWERKRRELSDSTGKIMPYSELREWIINDPEAKKIARDFHASSGSLEDLYKEVKSDHRDFLDLDNMYEAYIEFGLLDEEDADVNIAAGDPEQFNEESITAKDLDDDAKLQKRIELVRKLYRKLSPEARKILLHPEILLVFLGQKPAYVKYEYMDGRVDPDANRLKQEMLNLPEILKDETFKELNLSFFKDGIVSVAQVIERLKKDGNILVDSDIFTEKDVEILTSDKGNALDKKSYFWNTAAEFHEKYKSSNSVPVMTFRGFLCGYPEEDIHFLIREKGIRLLIESEKYGYRRSSKTSIDKDPLFKRWDIVLDHVYPKLASEEGFRNYVTEKVLEAIPGGYDTDEGPGDPGRIAAGDLEKGLKEAGSIGDLNALVPRIDMSNNHKGIIAGAISSLKNKLPGIEDQIDRLRSQHTGKKLKSQQKKLKKIEKEFNERKIKAKEWIKEVIGGNNPGLFYLFNAPVAGKKNYILGFNKVFDGNSYVGLSVELLERLSGSPELLAEYLLHELLCNKFLTHKELIKLQRKIFGGENLLKSEINSVIDERFEELNTAVRKFVELDAVREVDERSEWIPDARVFTSTGKAEIPIRMEFAKDPNGNGLSDEMIDKIGGLVSSGMRDMEGVKESGRSLIITLPEDNKLNIGGEVFEGIKIKMVNWEGGPPLMEEYNDKGSVIKQPKILFEVDPQGRIQEGNFRVNPKGGGFLCDAVNEYKMMGEAFNKGVKTNFPVGVGEFLKFRFNGLSVGFVVIAIKNLKDKKLGESLRKKVNSGNSRAGKVSDHIIIKEFKEFYDDFNSGVNISAGILRGLHEIGITHGNPHLDNFGISENNVGNIDDFNGARTIRNMTREQFIYWMFHDFLHFYQNTSHFIAGDGVERYFKNLRALNRKSFVMPLIEGYFTESDLAIIGGGIVSSENESCTLLEERVKEGEEYLFNILQVDRFNTFLVDEWFAYDVNGKTVDQFNYALIPVFKEIAGAQYDRLKSDLQANEQSVIFGINDNTGVIAAGKLKKELENIVTRDELEKLAPEVNENEYHMELIKKGKVAIYRRLKDINKEISKMKTLNKADKKLLKGRIKEVLMNREMDMFYFFDLRVEGRENYIAGFNKKIDNVRRIGLSVELIERLFADPDLIAEYMFHEILSEDILPHKDLIKLQRKIFGKNNELKTVVREVIDGALFKKRIKLVKEIYAKLGKKSRRILLHPDILLVFLGHKTGYIPTTRLNGDKEPDAVKLLNDINRFPEITEKGSFKELGLNVFSGGVISVPHFVERLKREKGLLVDGFVLTDEEADLLTSHKTAGDKKHDILHGIIVKLHDGIETGDHGPWHIFKGFIYGYPKDDILFAVQKDGKGHVIQNKYGFKRFVRSIPHKDELFDRWDGVLGQAYSELSNIRGFINSVPKKVYNAALGWMPEATDRQIHDGTPAEILEIVKNNAKLLRKALSGGGVSAKQIAYLDPSMSRTAAGSFKILHDAGIFMPAKEKGHYKFSAMMKGKDRNYTKTMINVASDIRHKPDEKGEKRVLHRSDIPEHKRSLVRELVKAGILHQINLMQKPVNPKKRILWHIIEEGILSDVQRSSFAQNINNASRGSGKTERIRILREGESVEECIFTIRREDPDAIIDVALSSADHIDSVPVYNGDGRIRMIVFEGNAGDLRQVEGVIAALRALHLKRDMVIAALLSIYSAMKGSSYEHIVPPASLLNSPREFARIFIFDLPPIAVNDAKEINDMILKLLTAA